VVGEEREYPEHHGQRLAGMIEQQVQYWSWFTWGKTGSVQRSDTDASYIDTRGDESVTTFASVVAKMLAKRLPA